MRKWPHCIEDVDRMVRSMFNSTVRLLISGVGVSDGHCQPRRPRGVDRLQRSGKLGGQGQNARTAISRLQEAFERCH